MKIILTSDVELWSWSRNFKKDIEIALNKLVELEKKENIPITFFVSLSDKGYGEEDYLKKIIKVIKKIKDKNIEFGIHTHCKGLSIDFIKEDNLGDYDKKQIIKILVWNKKELEKATGKKVIVHRAGNYGIRDLNSLNDIFKKLGLKIDSSNINQYYSIPKKYNNFVEIPPATNKEYSKKLIVWSPEQMSLKELTNFYYKSKKKTDILVINFHSFSVYGDLGKKKKIWYSLPRFVRGLLKPFIKKMKEKKRKNKPEEELVVSKNYEKLLRMIRFLKKQGDEFINFQQYLDNGFKNVKQLSN